MWAKGCVQVMGELTGVDKGRVCMVADSGAQLHAQTCVVTRAAPTESTLERVAHRLRDGNAPTAASPEDNAPALASEQRPSSSLLEHSSFARALRWIKPLAGVFSFLFFSCVSLKKSDHTFTAPCLHHRNTVRIAFACFT